MKSCILIRFVCNRRVGCELKIIYITRTQTCHYITIQFIEGFFQIANDKGGVKNLKQKEEHFLSFEHFKNKFDELSLL